MKLKRSDKKRDTPHGSRGNRQIPQTKAALVKRQAKAVLAARGKERLEMIIRSSDPAGLVRSLPETEVFYTIKEVGERGALDLIALTTPEQLTHILDLDLWKKDQIDAERASLWLELLESCGENKLLQFFGTVDPELLICLFRKLLRVTKTGNVEEEPRTVHGQSLFTLDGTYYIEFLDNKIKTTLTRILGSLCSRNLRFYQTLMESILWNTPAEDEATALKWRNGRLADLGFPDFYEALEIYSYVDPDKVRKEKLDSLPASEHSAYLPARVEAAARGSFFSLTLEKGVEQSVLDRLQWEIMALGNRILVADAADLADVSAAYESMGKAFQTLDLGLRYLSREDPAEAIQVLRTTSIVRVFQTGFSLALRLRRKAESMIRKGWLRPIDRGIEILDSPLKETIQGLLRKRPLFFCEESGGNERPFERLEEVAIVEGRLEKVSVLGKLVHESLGISAVEINQLDLDACYHSDPPISTICLTLLANKILHGKRTLDPIEARWLERLFRSLIQREPEQPRGRVRPEIRAIFLGEFITRGKPISQEEGTVLHWWVDFLIERLESSIGGIQAAEEIDPRYVDAFMVRK